MNPTPEALQAYRPIRSPDEVLVLHSIATAPDGVTTQARIRRETGLASSASSRAITNLEDQGLVEKCSAPPKWESEERTASYGVRFRGGVLAVSEALRAEYDAHADLLRSVKEWTLQGASS